MVRSLRFPIKGTYYYAANLAIEYDLIHKDTALCFKAEPDNSYDKHAVQIWLATDHTEDQNLQTSEQLTPSSNTDPFTTGLLLGYVPRQLAPLISQQLKSGYALTPQVIHRANRGKIIEIECTAQLHLGWFDNLRVQLLSLWIRRLHKIRIWLHHFITD